MGKTAATQPILIVQTAFLGDLLLSIPLIKNIRQKWPESPVHLVCREGLGSLFVELGLVHFFHEVKKGDSASYRFLQNKLADLKFERIFSPHESLRTAMFIKGLRSEQKIGFKKWWNFRYYDKRLVRDLNLPDALRQLSLLSFDDENLAQKIREYSQANAIQKINAVPEWANMSSSTTISTNRIPAKTQKRIAIFPGSVWPTKQWTTEGFIQLIQSFCKENAEVVLLGGPTEQTLAAEILAHVPKITDLVGRTNLMETLAWLKSCDLVVSNDSGGQHLAAVTGTPTVSVYGPTVLSLGYRPWNSKVKIVEIEGLACRPCGKHGHKKCPIGTHDCMKKISVQQVLVASRDFIPSLNIPSR